MSCFQEDGKKFNLVQEELKRLMRERDELVEKIEKASAARLKVAEEINRVADDMVEVTEKFNITDLE